MRPPVTHAVSGNFVGGLSFSLQWFNSLVYAGQTVVAMIREIFDESAYDRFLARVGASRSIHSYREFLREREEAMVRKPRCC
jgi:hypothetical protein